MRILRRPRFIDDLTEAYGYLVEQSPSAADRLFDEIDAVAHLISSFPGIGRSRAELRSGVHSFRVRPFQYILFYRRTDDAIILLGLIHGARDIGSDLIDG